MIIFLDIDGVMVVAKSWQKMEILHDGFPAFSKNSIATLQKILDKKVKIIITSSHKSKFSIEELKCIFLNRGLKIDELQKLPDNNSFLSRKDEITRWLGQNQINEDFVIIDDDSSLYDLPDTIKRFLIHTNPTIGLIPDHLNQLRDLFENSLA